MVVTLLGLTGVRAHKHVGLASDLEIVHAPTLHHRNSEERVSNKTQVTRLKQKTANLVLAQVRSNKKY